MRRQEMNNDENPAKKDENPANSAATRRRGADRDTRQPYAAEVEDYAGERIEPPENQQPPAGRPADGRSP
jgi:hypothetical protein